MNARKPAEPFALPVFDKAQIDWHPAAVDWDAVNDETEPFRRYFLEHFDDPETRLRAKNPKPFRIDH